MPSIARSVNNYNYNFLYYPHLFMLSSGFIVAAELPMLLVALGQNIKDADIPRILIELKVSKDSNIDFDNFFNWWTTLPFSGYKK